MLFSVRCSTTLPSESSMTRFSGSGRSSEVSQKSIECRAMTSNDISGFQNNPIRRLALEHLAVGFAEHLDMTERVVPIIGAEVEIRSASVFWNTVGLACFEIARKAALLCRM